MSDLDDLTTGRGGGLGGLLTGLAGTESAIGGATHGGLGGLLESLLPLRDAGGAITAADVRRVVGDDGLARIASELGVSADEAAEAVARMLPELLGPTTTGE